MTIGKEFANSIPKRDLQSVLQSSQGLYFTCLRQKVLLLEFWTHSNNWGKRLSLTSHRVDVGFSNRSQFCYGRFWPYSSMHKWGGSCQGALWNNVHSLHSVVTNAYENRLGCSTTSLSNSGCTALWLQTINQWYIIWNVMFFRNTGSKWSYQIVSYSRSPVRYYTKT